MNSTDFYNTATEILTALNLDRLLSLLEPIAVAESTNSALQPTRYQISSLLLAAKTTLARLDEHPRRQQVSNALALSDLFSDENIASMITAVRTSENTHQLNSDRKRYTLFYTFYSRLTRLREFLGAFCDLVMAPRVANDAESALLSFEIADLDGNGTDIDRLTTILDLIKALHETVARALNSDSRVRIAYLDSGRTLSSQ